jgi:two-component system nitrogen regulation sensor histidine kinase NtrY
MPSGRGYTFGVNARAGLWWATAATVSVLGAGLWLRAPSGTTLGFVALAIVWCGVHTWRGERNPYRWAFLLSLVVFLASAAQAERWRAAFDRDPVATRVAVEARATAAIDTLLDAEAAELQKIAEAALDAPAEQSLAFAHLDRIRGKNASRSVALVRGGNWAAWSGRLVAPFDSLPGTLGAVGTPFYLALYAIAGRGDDRAIAELLVHAERPADSLATAIDQALATSYGVEGFAFRDPSRSPVDSFAIVHVGAVPLLGVRAVAAPGALLAARALEHGRTRGGMALAFAVLFFLVATWRQRRSVGARFGVLAVAIAVVAIVPLSLFSNGSQLFDPAYFYVAAGGPFTGSIGALALTSALVLLGLLAAVRAKIGTRERGQALAAVLVVAGVGPFLLRDLARGIQFPPSGVNASLWLAWEGTIFLAAVSVLIAGAAAGRAALGNLRGLPLWIAPVIAAAAALFAPLLMRAPGAFPPLYPLWWVVAIAALALGRRAQGAVLATAIVAACGAVTLVWGQSVRARVLLAEHDVASLSVPDPNAAALLERFTAQLDRTRASTSRVELLARYAASDLANTDYPVELTSWDPNGQVIADLRIAMGDGFTPGVQIFAREVAGGTQPVLRQVPGVPGLHTILSVPHADRSVTTVVVAPRTRLLPRDPFASLAGLAGPTSAEPAYALRLSEGNANAPILAAPNWIRRGDELHGDWFRPSVGGRVARVHLQVELRGYEALATRGALIVLFDLTVIALLWTLLVVSDGAFGRWLRIRRRNWLRSYRAQLTLALFAFFVLPAGAFAVWSYRRLQADDQQSRDVLVRETLRGVATSTDSLQLSDIATKFDTPLFLYANGGLVGTSDPLLLALAPLGRLLPPEASNAFAQGEELTTSAEIAVGSTPYRIGFRAANESSVRLVLAAPARTDDLSLDRRRRDLGIFVLFATAVGALGALWLSGLAARQFSRPIRALQRGALALAAGEHEPRLDGDPPAEFQPVFSAFRQMARDIEAGREQEARAQRVLAWGEMARQVAHEIKNPLTPMRLGMQHLKRARHDPRVNFDEVLDTNVERVLSEIDRLDEIARAFSRYGTVPAERAPAEPVDVARVVHDVIQLERLGADGVDWRIVDGDAPAWALGRQTELREVLLNLLENARLADAREVTVEIARDASRVGIEVRDNGSGIPADVISRIFEPHFSTRTSGSGLGLAISRRIIEGWGGTVGVESIAGSGTTIRIALVTSAAV